jgi:hypothetical protein
LSIFKIGHRVFQIGNDIICEKTFVKNINDILDLGIKFVPNFFNSKEDILFNSFYSLPHDIIHLNKSILNFRPNVSSLGSYMDSHEDNPYDYFYKALRKLKSKFPNYKISIFSDSLKLQIDILYALHRVYPGSVNGYSNSGIRNFFFN